jgi:putative acetyltransferase
MLEKIVVNRSIIENRVYEFEGINDFMEKYILENKDNKEKCIKNGIKYFEIERDYEKEIKNIYEWIEEKINEINNNGVRPYFA